MRRAAGLRCGPKAARAIGIAGCGGASEEIAAIMQPDTIVITRRWGRNVRREDAHSITLWDGETLSTMRLVDWEREQMLERDMEEV